MQINFPGGWLMPALRPPHTVPAGDPRLIQVRARRISHLRRLKERYLPELGDIIEMPHTDYEYRAYCTHEQLAAALAAMALDINYVKSKSQATAQYNDEELYETNNAVWGTLYRKLSTHRIFDRKHTRGSVLSTMWPKPAQSATWSSGSQLAPTVRDLVGADTGTGWVTDDDADLIAEVPVSWDAEVPEVTRYPSGRIDHSMCSHGQSKASKKRCTRRNNKNR